MGQTGLALVVKTDASLTRERRLKRPEHWQSHILTHSYLAQVVATTEGYSEQVAGEHGDDRPARGHTKQLPGAVYSGPHHYFRADQHPKEHPAPQLRAGPQPMQLPPKSYWAWEEKSRGPLTSPETEDQVVGHSE